MGTISKIIVAVATTCTCMAIQPSLPRYYNCGFWLVPKCLLLMIYLTFPRGQGKWRPKIELRSIKEKLYVPELKVDTSKLSEMEQLIRISMQICSLLSSGIPWKKKSVTVHVNNFTTVILLPS